MGNMYLIGTSHTYWIFQLGISLIDLKLFSRFNYRSGAPLTLLEYSTPSVVIFSKKNEYRLPEYHRMDLGVTFKKNHNSDHISKFSLGIYNLYNRRNIYSIGGLVNDDVDDNEVRGFTLFPIMPFISYILEIHIPSSSNQSSVKGAVLGE